MHQFHFKIILDKRVFLVQTDTTVGLLSQNHQALAQIKERSEKKPFVTVTSSLKILKTLARVPVKHKNLVRRSKKSTFVYSNNRAIRVVKDARHAQFIKPFSWFYSTSANKKGLSFHQEFAFMKSDIIVENIQGLFEGESSSIYRLYKEKLERLR